MIDNIKNSIKNNPKAFASDLLLFAFLCLTISHVQHVLVRFEQEFELLSWLLAAGLELGTAYASFVVSDNRLDKLPRGLAALWLLGLLVMGYGLNYVYYLDKKAGDFTWALALIFPVSIALLSAIKPGLSTVTETVSTKEETVTAPVVAIADRLPQQEESLPQLPADRAKLARAMAETGATREEIAAHFSVSVRTVGNWLRTVSTALPENITEFPQLASVEGKEVQG